MLKGPFPARFARQLQLGKDGEVEPEKLRQTASSPKQIEHNSMTLQLTTASDIDSGCERHLPIEIPL